MVMFDRSTSTEIEVIDRWDDGFGWFAHPDEPGKRASHAIQGEDGVWVFDPLEAPGVHGRLDELGTVAGIAVQSRFHGRDAATFSEHYDVPVHLPVGMDRVAERVEARIERFQAPPGEWVELGSSGIMMRTINPLTFWREPIVYRPTDGTLRIGDLLHKGLTVGNERIACHFAHRFAPPRESFADLDPERMLFGHGDGVFDDAAGALEYTLDNARRHLPRAALRQALPQLIGFIEAQRGEARAPDTGPVETLMR